MTGADVLRQVREAMSDEFIGVLKQSTYGYDLAMAKQALDGCILLTREEADDIANVVTLVDPSRTSLREWAIALLIPVPDEGGN